MSASNQFYPLRVKEIKRETADAVSLSFSLEDEWKDQFHYEPGQYLTLRETIDGEDIRRSYSVCSIEEEGELRVAVKKVDGGKMSSYINDNLTVGGIVHSMPPKGSFTVDLSASHQKHYIAFAAGSGITPIISIIKGVLKTEPQSRVTLFYGNHNEDSIIFKQDLQQLNETYPSRLNIHHILSAGNASEEIYQGRITKDKARALLERFVEDITEPDLYLVCGPGDMIKEISRLLKNLRVDEQNIKFELFTTPQSEETDSGTVSSSEEAAELSSGESKVTVILNGDESSFQLDVKGENVLQAAKDAGLDPPFSCTGGVCSTCQAKLIKGKVRMDQNFVLTDGEVEEGYILTCQSHPTTAEIVVDYDEV